MNEQECKAKGGTFKDNVCTITESAKDKIVNQIKTSYNPSKEGKPFILGFILAFGIFFISIILGPIFPAPIGAILGGLLLIIGIKKKWFKKPGIGDIFLSIGVVLMYLIIGLVLGLVAIGTIPWWKIILAGLVADAISFGVGLIESAGYVAGVIPGIIIGIISGIVTFFIVASIVGGFFGFILGGIALLIILIPGSVPIVTITFIIIKLLLGVLF